MALERKASLESGLIAVKRDVMWSRRGVLFLIVPVIDLHVEDQPARVSPKGYPVLNSCTRSGSARGPARLRKRPHGLPTPSFAAAMGYDRPRAPVPQPCRAHEQLECNAPSSGPTAAPLPQTS